MKLIAYFILLLVSSSQVFAADCAGEISEARLKDLKKQADKTLKGPRGKTYVDSVMRKVGPDFSKAMLTCRDKNPKEKYPIHLDLVLEVGKGNMVTPKTRASSNAFCECLKKGFPAVKAGKPPVSPFYIYIEARMEEAEGAPAKDELKLNEL